MWNQRFVPVLGQAKNRLQATQTWRAPNLPDSDLEARVEMGRIIGPWLCLG
jgi:hypothetical protein